MQAKPTKITNQLLGFAFTLLVLFGTLAPISGIQIVSAEVDDPLPPIGRTTSEPLPPAGGAGSAVAAANAGQKTDTGGCGWTGISVTGCINVVFSFIVRNLIKLFGWILMVVGVVFDKILVISIVEFGKIAGVVNVGWKVLRDVCNMGFIFILLWIALQTVLGLGSGTKQAIIRVVLAALLINFSLVFTRIIIDAGNITTLMFYNTAKGTNATTGVPYKSISERVVNSLQLVKISSLVSQPTSFNPATVMDGPTKIEPQLPADFMDILIQGVGGILFICVTIFILGTAAILFLRRMIYLLFLMLLSPVPFFTYAVSGFGGTFGKWWSELFKQVFFAPAYMVMFYVSMTMIETGKSVIIPTGGDNIITQILYFVFATAMMMGALILANSMGDVGGSKIASYGAGKLKGLGTSAANGLKGAGNFAKRKTIGSTVGALGIGDKLAERGKARGGWTGRLMQNVGGSVSNVSGEAVNKKLNKEDEAGRVEAHKEMGELDKNKVERDVTRETNQALEARGDRATAQKNALTAEATRRGMSLTDYVRNNSAEAKRIAAEHTDEAIINRTRAGVVSRHETEAKAKQQAYVNSQRASVAPPPGSGVITRARAAMNRFSSGDATFASLNTMQRNSATNGATQARYDAVKNRLNEVQADIARVNNELTQARANLGRATAGTSAYDREETNVHRLEDRLEGLKKTTGELNYQLAGLDYAKTQANAKPGTAPAAPAPAGGTP